MNNINKLQNLLFSGIFMLLAGFTLCISNEIDSSIVRIIFPVLIILSGITTFLFSSANKQNKKAYNYHLIQGIGLIIFGIISYLFFEKTETFELITVFFLIMFGFFEIIFAFNVLNSGEEINRNILYSRLIVGGLSLIGGFVMLMTSFSNSLTALYVAGILIAFGGLSLIIFSQKIK